KADSSFSNIPGQNGGMARHSTVGSNNSADEPEFYWGQHWVQLMRKVVIARYDYLRRGGKPSVLDWPITRKDEGFDYETSDLFRRIWNIACIRIFCPASSAVYYFSEGEL